MNVPILKKGDADIKVKCTVIGIERFTGNDDVEYARIYGEDSEGEDHEWFGSVQQFNQELPKRAEKALFIYRWSDTGKDKIGRTYCNLA